MANSVDADEVAPYEPSHLDLHCLQTLRKHAYSNTLKNLQPKKGKFSDKKILIFFIFFLKT